MSIHRRWRGRNWLLAVGAVILIAGHGAVLYVVKSHAWLSAVVGVAVIGLAVIKHLGVFGFALTLACRRATHRAPDSGRNADFHLHE